MSSVDDRVVHMKFDNAQFEQGVKTTLSSLDSLNKGLKLEGATKGLNDLDAAGKKVDLGHIASAVDSISNRFKALSVVAITAIASITTKALSMGKTFVSQFTIDPIKSGLQEYETNLNSIQTILSNTAWQHTGLNDVNKALEILNIYSDKTIYNFSEMARNIGTFTAAGVKLDVATNAIKGIANLAAVSGSNAEQASTAMYQLSQALAAGKVTLMDWNSVVNAGMGGKVFQDALMETARVHGVAIDKMVKDAGGFRNTLENGWLTGKILTETLSKFTGDLTAGQLKSMGYTKDQISGILKMGKIATDAATKVKTFTQLIGTLQEAAGSGWAKTWQLVFGDFDQAKETWTAANKVLGGFIQASADARNKVLGDWNALGGRTVLIDAISTAFKNVLAILTPIKQAFRDIFPATTGKQLYDITVRIRDFLKTITPSVKTIDNLRRTFAGVFAILDIGWTVVKKILGVFGDLLGLIFEGSGGFLDFTGNIGDFFVALDKAIKKGEGLNRFFEGMTTVLSYPIKAIKTLISFIGSLFGEFDGDAAGKAVAGLASKLEPFGLLGDTIVAVWSRIVSAWRGAWAMFEPMASKIANFFAGFSKNIATFTSGLGLNDLIAGVNTGLLGYLVLTLTKIFGKKSEGGIIAGVKDVLEGITDTLGAMQHALNAATLLQIAAAIGILAVSVNLLADVDAGGLTRALSAIGVMFAQLIAALAIIGKIPNASIVQLYAMAGAMSLLAIAVDILSISVLKLAELDWDELARGLTGVVVLLGSLIAAARLMPPSAGLITAGAAFIILGGAIKILASAVKDLSGLSWEELAKGLSAVGALLGALTLFSKFAAANSFGLLGGAGILLTAAAIKVLASAMLDIADLSWESIGKGMTVLAGGLFLIGLALDGMPPTAVLSAAGIFIVAASLSMIGDAVAKMGGMKWADIGAGLTVMTGALTLITAALVVLSDAAPTAPLSAAAIYITAAALVIISDVMKKMGDMSWGAIGKAMTVLAGSLTIITIALTAMILALPGAAALLVVSSALVIFTGVLKVLGNMSWGEIGKGLGALALAFTVLGVAAALLAPTIAPMIGLGVAIALIGAGLALAGAGVFLFATGLAALSVSGAAATVVIVAMAGAIIGLIPMLVEQIGRALILLIKLIAEAAPAIVKAVVDILVALLDGIVKIAPKLGDAMLKLIMMLLDVLVKALPAIGKAGLQILLTLLGTIRDNIGKVVTTATDVIVNFLKGVSNNLPKIIQAGVDLILSFIKGLTKAINDNSEKMGKAGGDLAVAIIKGMVNGLKSGVGSIASAARDVAKSALRSAMDALGIHSPSTEFFDIGVFSGEGMVNGIKHMLGAVTKISTKMGTTALDAIKSSLSNVSVSDEMDLTPVITPVLDLSLIQRDAGQINGMIPAKQLTTASSYSSAQDASAGYQNNKDISDSNNVGGDNLSFVQNNYSPKALTAAEIYRNTKNQLSVAKGVVNA